ncbi:EAL domain-containing protein [Psychrobium sp. 1_MG-2023]|uniref:EAL domain-containing protein n=1 Tax=Psychrobium sp. 1_MG-2023 TaxID=3062624 RepID=UPI000C347D36|nr:EAL domain-containing protein [Psychrobium sp. 1_MG-2023]MDP2559754.1 EAL domain-containing protein [Psychrobium sp. 1_MG-2023]PKF59138.1 GGDEF domain-containing protein [Alteromonadales bacterium alter-6D02]
MSLTMRLPQGLRIRRFALSMSGVLLCAILLTWLYIQTQTVSSQDHLDYTQKLELMMQYDSVVDNEVLASYTGLSQNYDTLALHMGKLSGISADLAKSPSFLTAQDKQRLLKINQAIQVKFEQKLSHVDLFKREHAVYKNSFNYFNQLSMELMDTSESVDFLDSLQNYIRFSLYYIQSPEKKVKRKIIYLTEKLMLIAKKHEHPTKVLLLLQHGDVLLSYRDKITTLLNELTQLPLVELQHQLVEQYAHSYANAASKVDYYRWALFVSAISLSLFLAYFIYRLMATQFFVKQVNNELVERIKAQQLVENKLKLQNTAFMNASEAIALTDDKGVIIDINPAFTRITGYERAESIGFNPRVLKSGKHDDKFYKAMWHSINSRGFWRGEIWNRRKSGEIYPEILSITAITNESELVTNYVAVFTDITLFKAQEQRLSQMAYYDDLTKLPNRVLLTDRISQAMSQTLRNKTHMAVCFLDFDGFKLVNDMHGHHAGNSLLMEMSHRFKQVIRDGDSVARIGGDEFVFLLVGLKEAHDFELAIERILKLTSLPVQLNEVAVQVTASIGVTIYPLDDQDADTLLRNADQAMYAAKQAGKNRYHLFDPQKSSLAFKQNQKISRLVQAFQDNEFVLHYQPKVNMRTGDVFGAEALIRWQHPEKGLVAPNDFLPLIENHDLIVEIGHWVLESALQQMMQWQAQGLDIKVSVNVSSRQLQHPSFISDLEALLDKYPKIPHESIELEILETAALDCIDNVSNVMSQSQDIGVGFSLDDFGTGYSSLTYLKRLPATTLKMDTSFIRGMLADPGNLAIVHGILGLATAFQKNAIAEGVETLEHGVMLMKLGCVNAQGYAVSRPLPADEFVQWTEQWSLPNLWRPYQDIYWEDIDYPIFAAEVEHRYFVELLRTAVDSHIPITLLNIGDHRSCQFAKWYYHHGREHYQYLDVFTTIENSHQRIHQLAGDIDKAIRLNSIDDATALMPELIATRDDIIRALGELSFAVALKIKK